MPDENSERSANPPPKKKYTDTLIFTWLRKEGLENIILTRQFEGKSGT